jgi:ligand-binding SRPBCC domain-containing protein
MAAYTIKMVQKIPASVQEVWDFFSNPANLQTITPASLELKIISKSQVERIYAGQLIEYTLKPVWGIRVYWMTKISAVEDKKFFVDEQRKGPYTMWHHEHYFKEIPGGVEMTDIVQYKNPFWLLGNLANMLFVKKQLAGIFDFRFKKTEEVFGKWTEQE